MRVLTTWIFVGCLLVLAGCSAQQDYDVIIRNGTIYDGSGDAPFLGDVAIRGDVIAEVGKLTAARGETEIDAGGLAVAPGFINMLSWAVDELLVDPRSQSDIRQGVTLEVFGEGSSWGPWNDSMKEERREGQGDIKYEIEWTTLGEYLEYLERRGVATNVSSFVGATTLRVHEVGYEDRRPTPEELDRMRALVRQAMEEGALGVGSSLIYSPAYYAKTDELVELCKVAAEYDGAYISHIRSEGEHFLEAVDELITIARRAGIRAEIYHLKASLESNWSKMDQVIQKVEAARKEGLPITADMYLYTATSTGLDALMPPWVQEGGHDAWVERLKDPAIRARLKNDNEFGFDERSPKDVLLVSFKNDALKRLTGKTLAEVAASRGTSPEDTVMDLVIEDDSRVGVVYTSVMSEENIRKQIRLPWVSFGSDGGSMAPEGVFLKSGTHPRAYGNFARLLGKYVREEKVIPLEEAIRRLTSFPATNLKIKQRGRLAPGYFADVVVFDPATIQDHATFEKPHQYSTGVRHVFVNGTQVLKDGEHTGATPGRFVRGPGTKGS
ncbi:MAG: D-aminoacylase [Acidobacteriota bacterium]